MVQLDYAMPADNLCGFVSIYYLFDCPEQGFADGERAGIAQLRFILSGKAVMHLPTGSFEVPQGAFILGPTTGAMRFEIEGPFRMFGLGLLPAGWGALTRASAADFTDRISPAIQIFPKIEKRLEALQGHRELASMAQAADGLLSTFMADADPDMVAFTRMVDDWLASAASPDVADLRCRSELSDRHLTRRVKHLYGMPPKYLSRKYRALRAARAMVEADPNETDLLRDSFYDQSHMIRELKLFTGTTPTKLRNGEGELAAMIDRRGRFAGRISPLTANT